MEKYNREKHCGFGEPIWDTSEVTNNFPFEKKGVTKDDKNKN